MTLICELNLACSIWNLYSFPHQISFIVVKLIYKLLENSMSFNPQNSKSAKFEFEKTWKTRITRAKTRNTPAKVELDAWLNSTVRNLMKLDLDIKWTRSSTTNHNQTIIFSAKIILNYHPIFLKWVSLSRRMTSFDCLSSSSLLSWEIPKDALKLEGQK